MQGNTHLKCCPVLTLEVLEQEVLVLKLLCTARIEAAAVYYSLLKLLCTARIEAAVYYSY
jgi:hypothetical protein